MYFEELTKNTLLQTVFFLAILLYHFAICIFIFFAIGNFVEHISSRNLSEDSPTKSTCFWTQNQV